MYYIKGGWMSESFSLMLHLQKNVPIHYPEHYLHKQKMLKIVILHNVLEMEQKWKPFRY